MITNFLPEDFVSEHAIVPEPLDSDFILCFNDNNLLLDDHGRIPRWAELQKAIRDNFKSFYLFGRLGKERFLLVDNHQKSLSPCPALNFRPVKLSHAFLEDALFRIAGLACQLYHWRFTHVCCGHCGTTTFDKKDERAKICPRCQLISYPKLYPCVIVLVSRGDELLLARSPHFQPGVYSTLAGFIEPGESVENAVFREIKEEVNIRTQNIRYLGSQPWPYPSSLMLGFLAEYESGELEIDRRELEDAQWFKMTALPALPSSFGISHWLIENFLSQKRVATLS